MKIFLRDLMFLSLSLFAINWCLLGFEEAIWIFFEMMTLLIILEEFFEERP